MIALRDRIDETLEDVLALLDQGLGLEDVRLALGDGRLGVEDLERGQGPDVDLLLVLGQEIAGKLERLPLDVEAFDGINEGPVGLLDLVDRGDEGRPELALGNVQVVPGNDDLPAGDLGAEVLQEGLGEVEAQGASIAGVDELVGLVRIGLVVLEGQGHVAAPGDLLDDGCADASSS